MTELEKPVMSEDDAHRITERIRYTAMSVRDGVGKLQRLVAEAQEGSAHVALGYPSWTAYLADVMGDEPLRLARDERRDVVAWLSGQGMSTRAIAPIVGVDNATVHRDLTVPPVANATPVPDFMAPPSDAAREHLTEWRANREPHVPGYVDTATGEVIEVTKTVTGLDGKQYTRPAPTPPKAEAVTTQFSSAITDLNRLLDRFHRITETDAYRRNTETISDLHRADITRAITELTTILNTL